MCPGDTVSLLSYTTFASYNLSAISFRVECSKVSAHCAPRVPVNYCAQQVAQLQRFVGLFGKKVPLARTLSSLCKQSSLLCLLP